MSGDTAARRARGLEHATPDHLPVCPRCGELLEGWRIACPYCESRLYLDRDARPATLPEALAGGKRLDRRRRPR